MVVGVATLSTGTPMPSATRSTNRRCTNGKANSRSRRPCPQRLPSPPTLRHPQSPRLESRTRRRVPRRGPLGIHRRNPTLTTVPPLHRQQSLTGIFANSTPTRHPSPPTTAHVADSRSLSHYPVFHGCLGGGSRISAGSWSRNRRRARPPCGRGRCCRGRRDGISGADALVGFGELDVVKEWAIAAHTWACRGCVIGTRMLSLRGGGFILEHIRLNEGDERKKAPRCE
jgi:hypothetical protein